MRNPRGVGALACALLCAGLPATALADIPNDRSIDVQTFEYSIGPKSFFSVSDADVAVTKQLAIDALISVITDPFKIYNVDTDGNVTNTRATVVESMVAMQLSGAYGINDTTQVGVSVPFVFRLQGEGLMASTGMGAANGLGVTGIGDLLVEGKKRLVRDGHLRVAAIAQVSLPTSFGSDGSQFIGDDLPTLRGKMAAQYEVGKLSMGANLGVMFRKPRKIYDSTIGQQLTWGVAAAFSITPKLSVVGESFGRAGLPDFSLDASPLEAVGGLRLRATGSVAIVIGGGAGLVKGIGSPEARFFASLGYAPDVRDSDGDGIPNGRDKCVLVPEDKDGYQDDDGCPDDDNDGDHRPDAVDKCPNVAEDLDGFEDDDGCPEFDNDNDGFPDLQDKCPNDAEDGAEPQPKDGCPATKRDTDGDGINDAIDKCPTEEEDLDGFEDGDGCPDLDNDGDGIPDSVDKCPLCPEDKDGFEDDDGCPELDNDRDGIPDAVDKCPMEAEVINGVKDDDGCPDSGGLAVVKLDGDRLAIDRMPSLKGRGPDLSAAGNLIVDQVALFVLQHREVTKWLVAVAQPKVEAANTLAEAIKARLAQKGVPAGRVDVLGTTGPARIGAVVQERGDEGEFVCPAGREVQQRPDRVGATPKDPVSPPAVPPKDQTKKDEPKQDEPKKPASDEIEIE